MCNTECRRVLIILARLKRKSAQTKSVGTELNAPTITGTIEVLFFQHLPI